MDRETFIDEMNAQVRLVRAEYGFTQDVMARVLGLSKKTLVEIEKGRSSLGWMGAVAFCSLFAESRVLSGLLGGEASDMLHALAFADTRPHFPKTLGGKVWWREITSLGPYKIQQNIISQHYRALDSEDGRVCSSFELAEVRQYLGELMGESPQTEG